MTDSVEMLVLTRDAAFNEERNLKKKEQETLRNSQFQKNVTNMIFRVSYFILLLKSVT